MPRYVKRIPQESEDPASGRYWLKALQIGFAFQLALGAIGFLTRLDADGFAVLALVGVIACAVWLRYRG